jgi:hypothetical protein
MLAPMGSSPAMTGWRVDPNDPWYKSECGLISFFDLLCASVVQYVLLPSAATVGVVAIIDGARMWPVGHDPALRTDAIAIAQWVRADRWPVPRQGR